MSEIIAKCSDLPELPSPIIDTVSDTALLITVFGILSSALGASSFLAGLTGLGSAIAVAAVITFLMTIMTRSVYHLCNDKKGEDQCVAGVITNIVPSFNDTSDKIFPFKATHDRVDIVTKSTYWDIVEYSNSYVFCTDHEELLRRSEIMRCYYYDRQVCESARGAWEGAATGAVLGGIAALYVAGALCLTIILCIIGIILAVVIVAVAMLVGAALGAWARRSLSSDNRPSDETGTILSKGDLITVKGLLFGSPHDNGANVFWWVNSSSLCGQCETSIPSDPYSHCDIDEIFQDDACPIDAIIE